jgi:hypothetical protein
MINECKSWLDDVPVTIILPTTRRYNSNSNASANPNNQELYVLPEWFDLKNIKLTFKDPRILADATFDVIMNQPSVKHLNLSKSYIRQVPQLCCPSSSLDTVDLSHCGLLRDVSALANVRVLNIAYCSRVTDVSCLGRLEHLNLTCCSISDVSALVNAKTLFLTGTQVSDVSMLGNAHVLRLDHCRGVKDVSALGNVHTLSLQLTGVSDVSRLGKVHSLSLAQTRVVNVSMLGEVHMLDLTRSRVFDVSCLGSVHKLILDHCEHLQDVSMLGNVKILSIRGNKSLTGVDRLDKVHTLNMIGSCDRAVADVPQNVFLTVPHLSISTPRMGAYMKLLKETARPVKSSLYIDRSNSWYSWYYDENYKELFKKLARRPRDIKFEIPSFHDSIQYYTTKCSTSTSNSHQTQKSSFMGSLGQFKLLQLARADAANGSDAQVILSLCNGEEVATTIGVARQFKTLSDALDCRDDQDQKLGNEM